MRTETVTCDNCGGDITYTGNSVDYRVAVLNEPLHSRGGGAVTDMMIYPPLGRDHYFCSLRCLRESPLIQDVSPPVRGDG